MPSAEQFIALSVRNVKVIEAMEKALEAMTRVDLAAVEVSEGARFKLHFTREIAGLKEALYLMEQDNSQ